MTSGRIDRRQRDQLALVNVRQERDQPSAADRLPHDDIGKPDDPDAVERELQRGLPIVARDPRQDLRRLGAFTPMKRPGARWNGNNADMLREICRFGRHAASLKMCVHSAVSNLNSREKVGLATGGAATLPWVSFITLARSVSARTLVSSLLPSSDYAEPAAIRCAIEGAPRIA